ncbi:HGxxPAAW family protein [uncultured Cellulomonas sp.]|uniref:HGxxPAAW family protein n=1 Tax=uncultured Cellulomonas sp. TaxID=189682 RepID=UPI0028E203F5|nr:HGxxPAAW family protein [uncultured Cellulomonas sp.]
MADDTLAHRAQNATTTEAMHLPPTAAPTNHGKTLAAWFTTYGVVITFVIAGLGVLFAQVWLFWVGIGLLALVLVGGKVLQSAGHGQGGDKTRARQARTGGH